MIALTITFCGPHVRHAVIGSGGRDTAKEGLAPSGYLLAKRGTTGWTLSTRYL